MSSELKKASAGLKFYGSILLFLLFAIIFWFGALLHPVLESWFPGENLDAKRAAARAEKLAALQKDNDQKLTTYAWVNKDKGIVQIPIDQAMKLVVTAISSKQVGASSVKVEDPYPYGLQDAPAPAASGSAAPAAPAASGSAAPAVSGSTAPAVPAISATPAPAAAPATSGSAASPSPTPATSGSAQPQPAPEASGSAAATPASAAPEATPTPGQFK